VAVLRLFHKRKEVSETDADLLHRFQKEEADEALVALFDRYLELIYGLCLKYLKEEHVAQDAVMDIYLALRKKVPQHEIGHFKNWLFTFVRNHCLMELRRNKKQITPFSSERMQSEPVWHPIEEEDTKETQLQRMEDCLEQLAEQQKACVQLFYYQGLSYKDIAAQRAESLGRVRSYIQNGRRNLKNCMDQPVDID
jgi:RNA polymerase sigma factor (sigma-70 family)